jgi:hypothetical protein
VRAGGSRGVVKATTRWPSIFLYGRPIKRMGSPRVIVSLRLLWGGVAWCGMLHLFVGS